MMYCSLLILYICNIYIVLLLRGDNSYHKFLVYIVKDVLPFIVSCRFLWKVVSIDTTAHLVGPYKVTYTYITHRKRI